ncbi:hypothetical protein Tco_0902845 [Tanacetum coccineum]
MLWKRLSINSLRGIPALYRGGRLALIKAVLENLPTYYMLLYKVLISIERNLESMRNNFFIGGDLEGRKMTLVAWKKCLASKELGGYCVGSIFALNKALMFKWIWRFKVTSEDLWTKDIKNIYGDSGRVREASFPSFVRDGSSISFWVNDWFGDRPLKLQFPRVYALDDAKSCTVAERIRILDWLSAFRRPPRVDDELFHYTTLSLYSSGYALISDLLEIVI